MARFSPIQSTVFRLAGFSTVIIALVAAGLIYFIAASVNDTLTRTTEETLQADVSSLQQDYRQGGQSALVASVNEKLRWDAGGLYLLLDAQGVRRAGNLKTWPTFLKGGPAAGVFDYSPTTDVTKATRIAAGVLITLDDGERLIVARDIEGQRWLLSQLRFSLILGIGGLALLGLVGGYALARLVLLRIDKIRSASESIMAGNLSGRIPVSGSSDELDRLSVQLNSMLDRIEQLVRGVREVSDNIAHDLKTPLNRLRNSAETALADDRGPSAWKDGLERTIEQADDLMKTFNALLLIARLEAGAVEDSFERVDLSELCRDVAELYEPAAEEQGLSIGLSLSPGVLIQANRQLISQAVANLIDNAIKYGTDRHLTTPSGPSISISVSHSRGSAMVQIADRGPGIAAEDRERSVKRFVRLDQSRSKPGTGLGLSLVAAVAQLHQGTVELEDNAPGLRVVLLLPLDSQDGSMPQSSSSTPIMATQSQ